MSRLKEDVSLKTLQRHISQRGFVIAVYWSTLIN